MSMSIDERLRWARERAGYGDAVSFARAHGLNEVTYRSHENGTRGFKNATAQQYARLLHINYEWLQTGKGTPTKHSIHSLVGYVGAGAEVFPFGDENLGYAPNPPEGTALTEVVEVKGDSMYPAYKDGDLIYLKPKSHSLSDSLGKECMVKVADGRRLLKTLSRGSAKNRFTLLSYNAPPIEDVILEWAAQVDWVKRNGK